MSQTQTTQKPKTGTPAKGLTASNEAPRQRRYISEGYRPSTIVPRPSRVPASVVSAVRAGSK
ncbi:hypothetical protein [Puniceicoccus vermicola]|uniref:hypothetical protein n=1 Tax=Puniceicoccus vermicola TaxID=388746 RepID=UPI0033936626